MSLGAARAISRREELSPSRFAGAAFVFALIRYVLYAQAMPVRQPQSRLPRSIPIRSSGRVDTFDEGLAAFH
jgi:hypothetical protein